MSVWLSSGSSGCDSFFRLQGFSIVAARTMLSWYCFRCIARITNRIKGSGRPAEAW